MPKVNYDKEPERLCRWNTKFHGSKNGEYYCEDAEEIVDSDRCLKCFCNTWYNLCDTCKKEILKTELIFVFLSELKTGHICNDCYNDEEKVNNKPKEKELFIHSDIKKWQELNKVR